MALALLSVVTAGCFNPNHIGRPVEGENHVPIVDILPTPTLTPIAAAVSLDGVDACAPTEFNFISLDDSDGDILTVRWDLVFGGFGGEVRRELKSSPPLAPLDDGSYAANDSTDLSLDAAGLRRRLGADLDAQVRSGAITQNHLPGAGRGATADQHWAARATTSFSCSNCASLTAASSPTATVIRSRPPVRASCTAPGM